MRKMHSILNLCDPLPMAINNANITWPYKEFSLLVMAAHSAAIDWL
jgi:hypothetical protein